MKKLVVLGLFVVTVFINPLHSQSPCSECHGDRDFSTESEDGVVRSLFVDETTFQKSVHGEFACTDCHVDAEGDSHPEDLADVECGMCHDEIAEDYAGGIHGKLLLSGDPDAPTCASCHGKHDILGSSSEHSKINPVNLPTTCGQCHSENGDSERHAYAVAQPVEKFQKGVHWDAFLEGNEMAATCNDCHESHKLLPPSDPESTIYPMNISNTCGRCHEEEQRVYSESIHGVALSKGEFDSPSCTGCHGEHAIISYDSAAELGVPLGEHACSKCHGLIGLNEKYGLLPDVVDSYRDSYHGLASKGGSKIAARCSSCHGFHNVLPASDPKSSIHPENLQKTCGLCHPNASVAFAKSYIHSNPATLTDKITAIVKTVYIWLIVIVISGMFVHNFIIWLYFVRKKIRELKKTRTIQRFDKAWIIQHVVTLITFTILVITGFALRFPDAGWVKILSTLGMTEGVRGIVHRIAAVGMLAAALYQFYHLLFDKNWKGELKSLAPTPQDIGLFVANMKFHLGLSNERPAFDRYGYIEKAEYWALVWGTVIMALTGFVLWFPVVATSFLPSWIVKVSEVIHYYEAWLATLSILVYHMFFAIFHPEDYPINLTGFTGKMPEEEAKERFPAWYKKLVSGRKDDKSDWTIKSGGF